jgi:hypothetical protein
MDLWNRISISLIAAFLVVAAIVTLLAATEAVDPDFLPGGSGSNAWFYSQLNGLADFDGTGQAITVGVTIAVAVVMVAVIILEIPPVLRGRSASALQISTTPEGILTIDASSVRLLAERTGIVNRNISSLKCRLGVRGKPTAGGPTSIVIFCHPRVILGSNVPEVRDDLQTRIKEIVQNLTGITVLRVHVMRVRYDRTDNSRLMGA